jgi:hypothetical protein
VRGWDEYIAENPGNYSYSRFCELYRAFESRLPVTMRQTHTAGERLFVDYAGDGVPKFVRSGWSGCRSRRGNGGRGLKVNWVLSAMFSATWGLVAILLFAFR